MRDAGLYMVYMGLESGSETSLETLHKQTTVAQNEAAVATMKELGILFDFGFMMLDPSSTFESIEDNVSSCAGSSATGRRAAEFCRMVPYDGTPIKDQLAAEGRLRGDVCNPDYDFLDPRIERFFRRVNEALNTTGWIHGLRALSPQLKFAWNELAVMEGFTPYASRSRRLSRAAPGDHPREQRDADAGGRRPRARVPGRRAADVRARRARPRCESYVDRLLRERNEYVLENQDDLLAAVGLAA